MGEQSQQDCLVHDRNTTERVLGTMHSADTTRRAMEALGWDGNPEHTGGAGKVKSMEETCPEQTIVREYWEHLR